MNENDVVKIITGSKCKDKSIFIQCTIIAGNFTLTQKLILNTIFYHAYKQHYLKKLEANQKLLSEMLGIEEGNLSKNIKPLFDNNILVKGKDTYEQSYIAFNENILEWQNIEIDTNVFQTNIDVINQQAVKNIRQKNKSQCL